MLCRRITNLAAKRSLETPVARKQRIVTAKLDAKRVGIGSLMGLTISELMFVGVFGLFFLFSLGVNLPLLPKIVSSAIWIALPVLLFFIKRDGLPISEWLGVLIPFWLRQHQFRLSTPASLRSRAGGMIDRVTGAGLNTVSFRWETGPDGARELHVFEDPRRPYRAAAMNAIAERRRAKRAAYFPATTPQHVERVGINRRWLGSDADVRS